MTDPDFAILGAGIIGMSLAFRLAEKGHSVVIADPSPGAGASRAAAGMLAPAAESWFGEHFLAEIGRISQQMYPDFLQQIQPVEGDPLTIRDAGTLFVATDIDDAAELRQHARAKDQHAHEVHWLPPSQVRDREPNLTPRLCGGLWCPDDQNIDNQAVVAALVDVIRNHRRIEVLEEEASPWTGNGMCRGLELASRKIETSTTIIACGAHSAIHASECPVRPIKGQMLRVRMPPGLGLTSMVRTPRVYLVPRDDQTLLIGATMEELGFDTSVTAGGVYQLLDAAFEVYPAVYECELVESWAGLRPASRDNLPILGASPTCENLWFSSGHTRSGILLAPLCAEWLSLALTDGFELPQELSPSRFLR